MSNSNNSSENLGSSNPSANSMAENVQPFVSRRNGDVPIFGQRSRTATEQYSRPDPLRSIRRSAIDRVNRRKKYTITLKMSRGIRSLSDDSKSTLIAALANALNVENPENEPPRMGSSILNLFSNLFISQPSEDHE